METALALRLAQLNTTLPRPNSTHVLYWMQQAQRTRYNHALEFAVTQANELGLPLIVGFGLTRDFPEANRRHYAFMLQGLADVNRSLEARGIGFRLLEDSPPNAACMLADGAALVVTDVGYLRIQKQWREAVARELHCPLIAVETDVIVPVHLASDKEEVGARTLRLKIHRLLDSFLVPMRHVSPKHRWNSDVAALPAADSMLERLGLPSEPSAVNMVGGEHAAAIALHAFLKHGLMYYAERRNEPEVQATSRLSAYLHFGQISPLEIALAVLEHEPGPDVDTFLEQLIVRRELSMNFVEFNPAYDSYDALPEWAAATLQEHSSDPREAVYGLDQLENAETADPYWNAAQTELLRTGYMHNVMRMYWGKRVLEWMRTPQEAFETLLYLNNKYELDGRDPNSFAGVAWCFGKHDRPWPERPRFGIVRCMTASGLERKHDMDAYLKRVMNG